MTRPLPTLILSLSVVLSACERRERTAREGRGFSERDSAGVAIAENGRLPARGRGPFDARRELVLGRPSSLELATGGGEAAQAGAAFQQIRDVLPRADGAILVADAGATAVSLFDPAGHLLRTYGRRGEGPGELSQVVGIHACADSVFVVAPFDVVLFDSRGEYLGDTQYRTGGGRAYVRGVSSACDRLLIQETRSPPASEGVALVADRFSWIDVETGDSEALFEYGLLELWPQTFDGVARSLIVPWGSSGETIDATGSRIAVGHGRTPEVRVFDEKGVLDRIVRWTATPAAIAGADRARYEDVRAEWLDRMPEHPETRFLFPALSEWSSLPETKPFFDRIVLTGDGGLWVRKFHPRSMGLFDSRRAEAPVYAHTWMVFDADGEWIEDVTLPRGLDLRHVENGRVYGVARDSLDVETIEVWRLGG